ncbi:hypothetical protein [Rufibacter hautae]|uniref:Uncharacterized protein n=1 Tax=Rufibacter hautae TaxID=2595005 RepID=A0A5B6TJW1_9BACT|nr:hypothetical protein [Rufibacter hautae]KAA3440563.1 hypothetical protein FOA19_07900 [Rufibacter hautae]
MKQIGINFLLLLLPVLSWAQAEPQPYRLSAQLQTQVATDTVPWKHQKAAWDYTYMGDYFKALQTWDAQYPTMNRKVTAQDRATFAGYTAKNAKEYLLTRAAIEQLFIINEAHHNPRHRVFTQSLLADLYKQGYRYLALEALVQADSLINQRGYPVITSGYYTKEPQFGNLIREAIRLGYIVFGYDTEGNGKDRETGQGRNIQQVLQKDPKAKIIIHCGFDHVNEGPSQAWEKAMAGRLKEFTGIDPFTVDQEDYTETSATHYDSPFFQLSQLSYPAIYVRNDNGQLFTGTSNNRQVDVAMVHPKTKLVNGLPDWIWMNGQRKPYKVSANKITIDLPCLALAYKATESEQAVPIDVVEFSNRTSVLPLALPRGEYRLVLRDGKDKTQELQMKVK